MRLAECVDTEPMDMEPGPLNLSDMWMILLHTPCKARGYFCVTLFCQLENGGPGDLSVSRLVMGTLVQAASL